MSPSLIRRWPAQQRVGLALSHDGLCAVQLRRSGREWHVDNLNHVALPGLFHGAVTLGLEADLAMALRQLSAPWRRRAVPLHVAVPDTLGALAQWSLEQLPRRATLRTALARWRLANELRVPEQELECAVQYFGLDQGRHRLLAQGFDKSWLDLLRRALREAGLAACSLNHAFHYRYNHFHDRLTTAGRGAALVSLDSTAWSLLAWDAQGRPVYLRSARRSALDRAAPDWEALVEEVKRSVLGFVHAEPGREVDQLYVTGDEPRWREFAQVLDQRLACACTPLSPQPGDDARGALAVTAALAA